LRWHRRLSGLMLCECVCVRGRGVRVCECASVRLCGCDSNFQLNYNNNLNKCAQFWEISCKMQEPGHRTQDMPQKAAATKASASAAGCIKWRTFSPRPPRKISAPPPQSPLCPPNITKMSNTHLTNTWKGLHSMSWTAARKIPHHLTALSSAGENWWKIMMKGWLCCLINAMQNGSQDGNAAIDWLAFDRSQHAR